MKDRTVILLIAAAALAIMEPPGRAQQFEVKTHQLTNGMKLLMVEDHSIPNVALYLFHRVGSRNERTGITGLSHFFEHMMFNGARKYGPGMFDRVMEDNNESLLSEQLLAAAFTAHPYHWPVVGWMVDIRNWKREDLIEYYKTYYAPNNCEMVIAGDVHPEQVIELARRHFEPIPAQAPPLPVTTQEPPQPGERRVLVNKFAQLPLLQAAYHTSAAAAPDFVPLSVLEYILLRGQSSRLYQRLVDKEQVAISVEGGQSAHLDPFLFQINVQPRDGVRMDRVEKVLYEELDKAQSDLVAARELQKAKNTAVADFYRSLKTISGKANTLGTYDIVFGDYHRLFQTVDLINHVTREDVRRVAKEYLGARNRTVAILVPEAAPGGQKE
ncbi:MAG: pitrilysin family protein [Verrucomicrobiota bacterium]|jgi:zinc protease